MDEGVEGLEVVGWRGDGGVGGWRGGGVGLQAPVCSVT